MNRPNCVMRLFLKLVPGPDTLLKFLSATIPKSIKRIIVMVACFCEMEKMRGIKKPRLDRLNHDLDLVTAESFLYYIRDFTLSLKDNEKLFCCIGERCEHDIAKLCLYFAEHVPGYLQYGSKETMINDIAIVVAYEID